MNPMRALCGAALSLLVFFVPITMAAHDHEEEIPLGEVPRVVIEAAEKAVEGIELSGAEVEREGGKLIYELEGTAHGKSYEIEVDERGNVLEVEQDDDEDDDDDDDDKDDAGIGAVRSRG